MEQRILNYLEEHKTEIIEDLKILVQAEASTSDIEELKKVREILTHIIADRTGLKVNEHKRDGGHNLLEFEIGTGSEKILLLGHYDTVHPVGTFKMHQEGSRLFGPGVYDMKSGILSAVWAVKAFHDLNIVPEKKLVFLFNGDEETGSKESRELICERAKDACAALICEPPAKNGDLKTGRKGVLGFTIDIKGKASHAGNAHQAGINAIEEMAHEILFIQGLTDYDRGTTLNVGVCEGGTKANVVPARAKLIVDCRYESREEGERIKDAIRNLKVSVNGTERTVTVGSGRPPMPETDANMELFEIAHTCGERLGLNFSHQYVGGGSDGNFVADMGIPTLDGLGAYGDFAHSENEYLDLEQYIPRMALLASLLQRI